MAETAHIIAETTPLLRGLVAPWVRQLLSRSEILHEAIRAYGSPLNVVCASPFIDNIRGFEAVLRDTVDSFAIFYARKPNKSRLFVREAIAHGIGVDIASDDELVETLEMGCNPDRASVSAALLSEPLARRVIDNGIVTVVENEDQLDLLERVSSERGARHPILIRICALPSAESPLNSRLGFHPSTAYGIVQAIAAGTYTNLDLRGFHFHVNGYSVSPRRTAIAHAIELIDCARSLGLRPHILDVGGGFPVNYLASSTEWNLFQDELRRALSGKRAPITWNNDGLGLLYAEGHFHGRLEVYPYFNEKPKWHMLQELLSARLSSGEHVSEAINHRELQLRIEPGRALLDQCGVSFATVVHRSRDSAGELCVGVSMNFTQLRSSSADFLVDPIIIPERKDSHPTECYISGTYCMDRDLILKRKVCLPQHPTPGDVLCFLNTAGYMMHFLESSGHGSRLAANAVFDRGREVLELEPREIAR